MWKAIVVCPDERVDYNTMRHVQLYFMEKLMGSMDHWGIAEADISLQMFSDIWDLPHDGFNTPDRIDEQHPTPSTVTSAITGFAESGKDLLIYLTGKVHSNNGGLEFPESSSYLTPSALATALDSCPAEHILIIVEGQYAGQFTSVATNRPNVVVVTSCSSTQNTYVALDGRISFSEYLIGKLRECDSVLTAYNYAAQRLANMGTPYSLMSPQLAYTSTLAYVMRLIPETWLYQRGTSPESFFMRDSENDFVTGVYEGMGLGVVNGANETTISDWTYVYHQGDLVADCGDEHYFKIMKNYW